MSEAHLSDPGMPVPEPVPVRNPPAPSFLRRSIERNDFYILSALLIMLGCWMLMPRPELEGSKFPLTLRSLLILQAYECLVIGAAALLVWRLRILGDAFTLLSIELLLLLDPTFFSNSFLTLGVTEQALARSLLVNGVCLALLIPKLWILSRALRLRIHPLAFTGFILAAAVVYFGTLPLALRDAAIYYPLHFYLLAWFPMLWAAIAPAGRRLADFDPTPSFADRTQRIWLRRWFLLLPLLIPFAHLIESAHVHFLWIRLYPAHIAPFVLAVGFLLLRNFRAPFRVRMLALDCTVVLALVFSLRPINLAVLAEPLSYSSAKTFSFPQPEIDAPAYLLRNIPLYATAAAVSLVYLWTWLALRRRSAAYHLLCLGGLAVAYLIWRTGIVGRGWGFASAAAHHAGHWAIQNPAVPASLAAVALLALALIRPGRWTWFLFGIAALHLVWRIIPAGADRPRFLPEFAQASLALVFAVEARYGSRTDRTGLKAVTLLVLLAATLRHFINPQPWSGPLLIAEALGAVTLGMILRWRLTAAAGAGILGLGAALATRRHTREIDPGWLVVGGGLVLFSLGLLLSFFKMSLLAWWERRLPEPTTDPDPDPPFIGDDPETIPTLHSNDK